MKTRNEIQTRWLAIARESLIRSGQTASYVDSLMDQITGDYRDIDDDLREWAFELASDLASKRDLEQFESE